MSITRVQATGTGTLSPGSSAFTTLLSSVTTGNLIVVVVGAWQATSTATSLTVTDSQGNTYTVKINSLDGVTNPTRYVGYTRATSTGSLTVTATMTFSGAGSANISLGVAEYSGSNLTYDSAFLNNYSGTGSWSITGNQPWNGGATTELLISAVITSFASNFTADPSSPWSKSYETPGLTNVGLSVFDDVSGVSGTAAPTWTVNGTGTAETVGISFYETTPPPADPLAWLPSRHYPPLDPPPTPGASNHFSSQYSPQQAPPPADSLAWLPSRHYPPIDPPPTPGASSRFSSQYSPQQDRRDGLSWHQPPLQFAPTLTPPASKYWRGYEGIHTQPPPIDQLPWYHRPLQFERVIYPVSQFPPWFLMLYGPVQIFTNQLGLSGIYNTVTSNQQGRYRVQNNIAGYNLYVGIGTLPDLTQAATAFSNTLPFSYVLPLPGSGTRTYYLLVQAQDHYGLVSQNQQYQTITLDSSGNLVLPPMIPPSGLLLFPGTNQAIRVLATYGGYGVDTSPADTWNVWISNAPINTSNPATTVVDVTGAYLAVDLSSYAVGLWYIGVALFRAADNTLSTVLLGSITIPPLPTQPIPVRGGYNPEAP